MCCGTCLLRAVPSVAVICVLCWHATRKMVVTVQAQGAACALQWRVALAISALRPVWSHRQLTRGFASCSQRWLMSCLCGLFRPSALARSTKARGSVLGRRGCAGRTWRTTAVTRRQSKSPQTLLARTRLQRRRSPRLKSVCRWTQPCRVAQRPSTLPLRRRN